MIIIDYGAGNLPSVANAVAALGYESNITGCPSDLFDAHAVILPGAAADTMANLNKLRLGDHVRRLIAYECPCYCQLWGRYTGRSISNACCRQERCCSGNQHLSLRHLFNLGDQRVSG
jgi:hypothetical protein